MKKKNNSDKYVRKKDLAWALLSTIVSPLMIWLAIILMYLIPVQSSSYAELIGAVIIILLCVILITASVVFFTIMWVEALVED